MNKPEIIKMRENGKTFFSYLELPKFTGDIPKKLKEKKYVPLYSERFIDTSGKIKIKKYLVKSAQDFYIYLEKDLNEELWSMSIYFEESQENELQFFINNFNKTFNDATTNN